MWAAVWVDAREYGNGVQRGRCDEWKSSAVCSREVNGTRIAVVANRRGYMEIVCVAMGM